MRIRQRECNNQGRKKTGIEKLRSLQDVEADPERRYTGPSPNAMRICYHSRNIDKAREEGRTPHGRKCAKTPL